MIFTGPTPFQQQIPGLMGWYDATDPLGTGSIPADTAAISSWVDKTGNGRNAVQATGTNQPQYQYNISGGKPAIYFDGSNDWLRLTQYNMNSSFTFVCVAKPATTSIDAAIVASNSNTGGKDQIIRIAFAAGNPFDPNGTFYSWNGPPTAYAQEITPSTNTAIAVLRQPTTTTVNARWNGTNLTGQSRSASTVGFGQIGALGGTGPSGGSTTFLHWYGHIMEILVYGYSLSDAQCQFLEQRLSNKWGIAI